MPRNASGTYSLPEPPFVTQTTISSTVMNSQLSDIANNLTTSVASTGVTPLTGGLKGIVSSTVAYGFDGDATTGWGSDTAGAGYFKSAGTEIVRITGTGVAITGTLSFTGGFSGTVSTSGSSDQFIAFEGVSTLSNANIGPSFSAYRFAAPNGRIGSYDFYGLNTVNAKTLYARIFAQVTDSTSTVEDADIYLQRVVAGTVATVLQGTATGVDLFGLVTATTGFKVGSNPTAIPGKAPTYQVFTSGTGATYTTAAGATWLRVRVVGGGGGGTSGGSGGQTIFNGIQANGGSPGSGINGGAGGSGGVGSATLRISGSNGGAGSAVAGADPSAGPGGPGGNSPFFAGGGPGGTGGGAGGSPIANSGSGSGGAGGTGAGASGNGGGGSGEYYELIIAGPAASYVYTVGAGGTSTSTAGAAGRIIVEEHYS